MDSPKPLLKVTPELVGCTTFPPAPMDTPNQSNTPNHPKKDVVQCFLMLFTCQKKTKKVCVQDPTWDLFAPSRDQHFGLPDVQTHNLDTSLRERPLGRVVPHKGVLFQWRSWAIAQDFYGNLTVFNQLFCSKFHGFSDVVQFLARKKCWNPHTFRFELMKLNERHCIASCDWNRQFQRLSAVGERRAPFISWEVWKSRMPGQEGILMISIWICTWKNSDHLRKKQKYLKYLRRYSLKMEVVITQK